MDKQTAFKLFTDLNPDVQGAAAKMEGANQYLEGMDRFSKSDIAMVSFTEFLHNNASRRELDLVTVFQLLEPAHAIMSGILANFERVTEEDTSRITMLIKSLIRLDLMHLFKFSEKELKKANVNLKKLKKEASSDDS